MDRSEKHTFQSPMRVSTPGTLAADEKEEKQKKRRAREKIPIPKFHLNALKNTFIRN